MVGLCFISNLSVGAVIRHAARTTDEQQQYLRRYGYLNPASTGNEEMGSLSNEGSASTAEVSLAIQKFQHMAGITETGTMTQETIRMMERPRCGVADYPQTRNKRFAAQGSRWSKSLIKYKLFNFTLDLPRTTVERDMEMAFKLWSDVAMLSFRRQRFASADIDIMFVAGAHLDGNKIGTFDGAGGTLAHAFYPRFGGNIHFDEDETWTSGSYSGTNLLQVATHEIGHSLGLRHSEVKESIMAPFYKGYVPNLVLHADDISGIRSIYGTKMATRDKRSSP